MQYEVILNPSSANGAAGKKRHLIEAALRAAKLDYRLHLTAGPGHAVDLARRGAEEGYAVVAAGGDGTVHEVSQGVIASGCAVPLGVIPVGTGNDFVKMIGVPTHLQGAVQMLAEGHTRRVDYGVVQWEGDGAQTGYPFVNAVGIGFDALVAAQVQKAKVLPGVAGYVVAVLRTLPQWRSPAVVVQVETPAGARREVYQGPLLLATAGNGASSGGGFYLTPQACIDDGLLDLCVIHGMTTLRILWRFLSVMRGRHQGLPEVCMAQGAKIHLASEAPLPVHADGEVLTRGATRVQVAVVPGRLWVFSRP